MEGDSSIDRLVALLGGWPDHFEDLTRSHGESILMVLRRNRSIDEVVFGLVCRYAVHRAAWDTLSAELAAQDMSVEASDKPGSHYLSGKEQSRAFHENKLLTLERELLATPYARVKNGISLQSDFMDLLDESGGKAGERGQVVTFSPLKPLGKRGRG